MALNVLVAASAEAALAEACAYIGKVLCEPSAVDTLLDKFDEFVAAVADLPDMYPLCGEQRLTAKGIRKALIGGYVTLYVHDGQTVTVVALFHQTQDYAKLV